MKYRTLEFVLLYKKNSLIIREKVNYHMIMNMLFRNRTKEIQLEMSNSGMNINKLNLVYLIILSIDDNSQRFRLKIIITAKEMILFEKE